MFSLEGQKVVVIGAGSGIGAASAIAAASIGAEVILAGRSAEKLAKVREVIGSAANIETVDVTDEESMRDLFAWIGPFDHLLMTAKPASPPASLAQITRDAAEPLLATKLFGAIHALKYGSRSIRQGGSVTLVSGVLGWRPGKNAAILGAVNGALASLTMAAALELAPTRVNAIAPGIVDTPTWAGMPADRRAAFFAEVAAKLPVGRVGQPEDIAEAAIFLICNGFTTGTVLHVDGGALIS